METAHKEDAAGAAKPAKIDAAPGPRFDWTDPFGFDQMLSGEERDWLNAYHAEVFARIAPLVDADTRGWLQAATAPI